ncbi:hypothetical protein ACSCBZ_46880 [Streptomyces niveiscabiei]|uniref:hypothetical protein n=1 Tax=Streptomyces niveiscabiei TaxID=164115 RepID=UPI003EB96E30
MTTKIMARTQHAPDRQDAERRLGDHLLDVVRRQDAALPDGRRARRTLAEMAPGYERQPLLTLHRPVMADDACGLCGRWNCKGSDCPPGAVPAPAATTHTAGRAVTA